jgi:type I restriction enzyme S subunit
MMIFRTKQWKFVSAFLNSQVFKSQSGLFSTSTINQLTVDMLKNIYIAFPTSVREQENIYEKSVEISNDIKKIIDKANMQIDLIKQYRQSLIYEFASGKRIVN